jgi:threonyl-tRNA synthetase
MAVASHPKLTLTGVRRNKTEMEACFTMLEEAKKRDHRELGAEMGLYMMDTECVGPGLPPWLCSTANPAVSVNPEPRTVF